MARAVPLTELPVQTALQANANLNQALANASRERMQGRDIRAQGMSDSIRAFSQMGDQANRFMLQSLGNKADMQRQVLGQQYGLQELNDRFRLGSEAADAALQREMWKAEFDATGQTPQQIDEAVSKINAGEMQWATPDGQPALQVTRDEYVERTRQRRESEAMQAKERSIQELMTKGEHDLIAQYDAEIANIRTSPLTIEEQNVEIARLEGMKRQVREAVNYDMGARLTSQEARKAAAQPKTQLVQLSDGTSVAMYNDGQGRWGLVPQNNMLDAKGQPLMPTGAGSRAGSGVARGKAGQATDEIGDTGVANEHRARDLTVASIKKQMETDPAMYLNGRMKGAIAHLDSGYPVNGQVLAKSGANWSADQVYAAMGEISRMQIGLIEQDLTAADMLDAKRVGAQQQQATQQAGIMQRMAQEQQAQQQRIAPVLNAIGNEEAAQRPQRIVAAAIGAAAPGQGTSANAGGLKAGVSEDVQAAFRAAGAKPGGFRTTGTAPPIKKPQAPPAKPVPPPDTPEFKTYSAQSAADMLRQFRASGMTLSQLKAKDPAGYQKLMEAMRAAGLSPPQ